MVTRVFKPRVAENCSAPGTSAFSLSSALTAHVRFSSACSTGDTVDYHAVAVDGSGVPTGLWEEGVGTYSATNTLTRTTIKNNSSGTTSAINFSSGNVVVMLTPNAERLARTAMEFVSEAVASASSAIDFTGLSAEYDYEIRYGGVEYSASVDLLFRASTDGGATWKSGGADYTTNIQYTSGGSVFASYSAGGAIHLGEELSTGVIKIVGSTLNIILFESAYYAGLIFVGAEYAGGGTVNAIRLLPASGTITSGSFRLYRLKRGA